MLDKLNVYRQCELQEHSITLYIYGLLTVIEVVLVARHLFAFEVYILCHGMSK